MSNAPKTKEPVLCDFCSKPATGAVEVTTDKGEGKAHLPACDEHKQKAIEMTAAGFMAAGHEVVVGDKS